MIAKATLISAAVLMTANMAVANPLEGTWDCAARKSRTEAMRTLLKYRSGGTLKHQANFASLAKRGERLDFSATVRGKWKFKPRKFKNGQVGGDLVEQITDLKLTGVKVNKVDMTRTPVGKFMKELLPAMFEERKLPFISKVRFLSKDQIKIIDGKTILRCTRRK